MSAEYARDGLIVPLSDYKHYENRLHHTVDSRWVLLCGGVAGVRVTAAVRNRLGDLDGSEEVVFEAGEQTRIRFCIKVGLASSGHCWIEY